MTAHNLSIVKLEEKYVIRGATFLRNRSDIAEFLLRNRLNRAINDLVLLGKLVRCWTAIVLTEITLIDCG